MAKRGSKVGYRAIHNRVESKLGKPRYCEQCGARDKSRYHWANIDHKYSLDMKYWKRLCARCHTEMDGKSGKTACAKGHDYTPTNTRWRDNGQRRWRICRQCQSEYINNYILRKRIAQ